MVSKKASWETTVFCGVGGLSVILMLLLLVLLLVVLPM
jgi:hypothetical protein